MIGSIPVENSDTLAAVRGFFRQLMETGLVDALFLPLEIDGGVVTPALVTDPAMLEYANPFAPAMPINGARAVSALTCKGAPGSIGAVLRPCELRALIELVKLKQADLEHVTLISLDCPGTYEWSEFVKLQQNGGFDLSDYLASACEGRSAAAPSQRMACQMCLQPVPEGVDIHLQLYGADLSRGIPVALDDDIADRLEYVEAENGAAAKRQEVIEASLERHAEVRQREMSDLQARLSSNGGLPSVFAACIRCHNCMTACPVCYCKNCLFRTASFDHPPEHYLNAAHLKGALRMPGDTMLFHLTRLNHMGASCVSCGMCTSACPADIPVGLVFTLVGGEVQNSFSYLPGRDLNEPLPLVTFQADEWLEIGEKR